MLQAACLLLLNRGGPLVRPPVSIRCCADTDDNSEPIVIEGLELPLFDPLTDQIPFPFACPSPTNAVDEDDGMADPAFYRYAFDRPAHLRMLQDTYPEDTPVFDSDGDVPLFGHCVSAGDGEVANQLFLGADSLIRAGTCGVALRIYDVQRASGGGVFSGGGGGFGGQEGSGEVAVAAGVGKFRFKVEEVTQTIPYPVAVVSILRDEPCEDDTAAAETAELETQVAEAIGQLVELSRQLEAKGIAAEAAAEALAGPDALLRSHERAVLGAAYASQTERWEVFSLGACEVISMPYEAACEAIATTSGKRRLQLLLEALTPAVQEMAALASLDGLAGSFGGDADGGLGGLPPEWLGSGAGSSTGVAAGANARPSQFGGTTAFTPIDIPLGDASDGGSAGKPGGFDIDLSGDGGRGSPLSQPEPEFEEGFRLEYWWDPELQWLAATVKRKVRDKGQVLHTLEFDMDGAWEDVSLTFDDGKPRFRPLR
jgi:hypothetical protein